MLFAGSFSVCRNFKNDPEKSPQNLAEGENPALSLELITAGNSSVAKRGIPYYTQTRTHTHTHTHTHRRRHTRGVPPQAVGY